MALHPIPWTCGAHILYSQTPQVVLDPITNPSFGGPWDLPAYTPLEFDILHRSLSSHAHTRTQFQEHIRKLILRSFLFWSTKFHIY